MDREDKGFEVLGLKLKLSAKEEGRGVASEAVALVRTEADKILSRSPNLDRSEVAVLVALKLASEKLGLEGEYRDNIERLHVAAEDALQYIEEASPTA